MHHSHLSICLYALSLASASGGTVVDSLHIESPANINDVQSLQSQ